MDQYNQCANITDHITYNKKHQIVARLFNGDVSNLFGCVVTPQGVIFIHTLTNLSNRWKTEYKRFDG